MLPWGVGGGACPLGGGLRSTSPGFAAWGRGRDFFGRYHERQGDLDVGLTGADGAGNSGGG